MRELIWCYMYCRKYLTEKYKKVCEVLRKRNPEARRTWTQIKSYTRKKYRDEQKYHKDGDRRYKEGTTSQ